MAILFLSPVVRISKSPPLRSLITRLFRLTENKLRELMGYRGRLKGINVDADMDDLITRFLKREYLKETQEDKGPTVVIDPEKLERLQSDSEIVRTMLTVENMDEQDYEASELEATIGEIDPIQDSKEELLPVEVIEEAQAVSIGSEAEQFANALSPLQREALLALLDEDGSQALLKLAAANGTMSELLIDEINEIAMDILGDLIIEGEDIVEEYISMLRNI